MKKHLLATCYIVYSLLKFILIKLFHFKHFKFPTLSLFSPFTVVDLGTKSKLLLGKRVRAKSGTKIKVRNKATVIIGQDTSFNHGCMVISHQKIVIGNNVQFGPNVLIYDHDHDFRLIDGLKDLRYVTEPVIIGDNVWIGANTIILRGTIIGDNCVIGAGSVLKGVFEKNKIIIQKKDTVLLNMNND